MKSAMGWFSKLQSGAPRVSLLALGIALTFIWAMSIYANHALRVGMQLTLSEQQFSTASIVAAHLDDELQRRLKVLTLLTGQLNTEAAIKDATKLNAFLSSRPMLIEDFNGGIFIVDIKGTAIADFPVVPGRVGTNYMDREAVSIPLNEGRSVIGKPNMGKTLKAPLFSIVVPIRSAQGTVLGCIVGTINLGLPNFLDKVSDGHYGKAGSYFVHAPQYRLVVTALDKSRQMELLPPAGVNPGVDRLLSDSDVRLVFVNTRGVEVLASGVTIPVSKWRLVVSVPTSEAFAPIHDLQLRVWIAAVTASFLGCALTWWLLKSQHSAELGLHDPLTHLANRRLLLDRLGQTMAHSQRDSTYFAVMVLDLDNFKPLNDQRGHLAGDELLIEVANRLKGTLRDIDTVARFGGDEFVVVLGDLGAEPVGATEQAAAVAEKIRASLAARYRITIKQKGIAGAAAEHHCTASVGLTLAMGQNVDPAEVLKLADAAMYQAKEAGRNQVKIA